MPHPERSWHPKKLAGSKWTALQPQRREKHFLVVALEADAEDPQRIIGVTLEAVLSKRQISMHWSALTDTTLWQPGWH